MKGEAVAWRNRVGDLWHYCERDPREVHDNGKQTDALVLATGYAELLARYEHLRAWFIRGDRRADILPLGHIKVYSEAEFDAALDAALTDQGRAGEGRA